MNLLLKWLKSSTGRFSESKDVSCWGCSANSTYGTHVLLSWTWHL